MLMGSSIFGHGMFDPGLIRHFMSNASARSNTDLRQHSLLELANVLVSNL